VLCLVDFPEGAFTYEGGEIIPTQSGFLVGQLLDTGLEVVSFLH